MTGALSMADSPAVSVIMNCLNGSKYLKEAIDSVYAQTYADWEIIFWDNASTDNSAEIAKGYDEKLRYFRGDETVPLCVARNFALHQARGKYIAFLDCDDIWLPQKLEQQTPLFDNNMEIGMVYSNAEIIGGSTVIAEKHAALQHATLQPSGKIFRQMLRHYNINIQTVVISKAALYSLGEWFDSSLNHSGDTDLFLRLAHNWNVKYIPAATAKYREHGENRSLKYAEDIPVELEYIIGKLARLYRDFRKEYEMELIELRMRLQKGLAVAKWKSEKGRESRKLALKHLASVPSFVLVYFLSFFPYNAVSFFRKLLRIR